MKKNDQIEELMALKIILLNFYSIFAQKTERLKNDCLEWTNGNTDSLWETERFMRNLYPDSYSRFERWIDAKLKIDNRKET